MALQRGDQLTGRRHRPGRGHVELVGQLLFSRRDSSRAAALLVDVNAVRARQDCASALGASGRRSGGLTMS